MWRSRIVRWLRVILPLAALVILSVLFLVARAPEPGGSIPYAEGRLEDLARRPGITAPEYSTVTPDGAAVTLSAAAVSTEDGSEGAGTARDLTLDWRGSDGMVLNATATGAELDGPRVELSGDVDLRLSSGWRLTAPRLVADTGTDELTAPETVSVTAPFGDLTAGAMRLARGADGRRVLELNRGVRLLYRP